MRAFQSYIPKNIVGYPDGIDERPLDLEIGCGVGLHPILYCQNNPDRQLIAIEHTAEKFQKFAKRADRHKLNNLFPVHANGISFVSAYKENRAYDRIFLLYPNPNPKPSQLNKRWHAMPFMSELWTCLAPLGTLTLVTNEEWYFKEAIHYFKEQWQFPIKETLAFSKQSHPQWQGRTHFEIKYLERGQTCFQLTLEKPA